MKKNDVLATLSDGTVSLLVGMAKNESVLIEGESHTDRFGAVERRI
jgi:hypothetical protein